jgi:hypothetical protein
MGVAFRRHALAPLDDGLPALKAKRHQYVEINRDVSRRDAAKRPRSLSHASPERRSEPIQDRPVSQHPEIDT